MPITAFQKKVLKLIKSNRSPDSYIAGGTAIQRAPDSLRFSDDIDFFHDADQAVTEAYQTDRAILLSAGYTFDTQISQPSFYRATVKKADEQLADSAAKSASLIRLRAEDKLSTCRR